MFEDMTISIEETIKRADKLISQEMTNLSNKNYGQNNNTLGKNKVRPKQYFKQGSNNHIIRKTYIGHLGHNNSQRYKKRKPKQTNSGKMQNNNKTYMTDDTNSILILCRLEADRTRA